jgi:hypothetical protein
MDPVVGRNQTGESFKLKLFDALKQNSPVSHESGTYGKRTPQKLRSLFCALLLVDPPHCVVDKLGSSINSTVFAAARIA